MPEGPDAPPDSGPDQGGEGGGYQPGGGATANLQIWRADGGSTNDSDFFLLETVAAVSVGDPVNFTDTDVETGTLYAYKSRYVCPDDITEVGAFSLISYARGQYPSRGSTNMSFGVTTAAQTQVGVGVERYYGQAVQVAYGLDVLTSDLRAAVEHAESTAHRNTVAATSDETAAASSVSGPVTFDLRPNGGSLRALLAGYTIDNTQTVTVAQVGTIGNPGYVAPYYIYKAYLGFTDQPITIVDKQGPIGFVFSGGKLNTLSLDFDKNQKTPIRATTEYMGLNFCKLPAASSNDLTLLGLSALSYDSNLYGPTDWALSIGGVQNPDCDKVTHSANRNLGTKQVGDYYMGAQQHFADTSSVSPTADFFWQSMDLMQQFWGELPTVGDIYGVGKPIITTQVVINVKPPAASNGVVYGLQVVYPVCSIMNLTKPKPETGPFRQSVTFKPRQDPANGFADHYLLITSTESYAALTAPQPELPVHPKTDMYAYNAIPGVAVAGGTTTSIPVAANAYLSAVDNSYNGLILQFTTGALAGQQQAITAYNHTTRTFTTAAFTGAPAAGDNCIVIGGFGIL